MKHELPKRFALIGLPGSGKSTFAAKLGKLLHIPVHHLDRHMFEPGGKKRDKQEFIAAQKAMVDEDSWVIEGCSFSTFEMRFARAETVIYFLLPRFVCYWRLFKRLFDYDKSFGGLRVFNWELLKYVWNFDREKRERIEELRRKYSELEFLVFGNQRDADQYVEKLNKLIPLSAHGEILC